MLLRFDPLRELDRLSDNVGTRTWAGIAPLDAYRKGDEFHVFVDLPGVTPQGIDLTVERNVLTVRAERRWAGEEGIEVLVSERPQGEITRRLFLGESLDTDGISANYEDGVLHLVVPVRERAKARKVVVGASRQGVIETKEAEVPNNGAVPVGA